MKWLLLLAACGSTPSSDDALGKRIASMGAVKTPITLEAMELDATGAQTDRAVVLTRELRAAAREYAGVTIQVSGKHLVDLKLLANCEAEAPRCMSEIAKSLPADRMIYGRIDRAHVELRMSAATSEVVGAWSTDQVGTDEAALHVTAREAIQALLTR